ncbi:MULTISPECIES: type I-C CRISPR-associated protein Cas5c [Methylococcus]|jgi:CRISPR-associated protein Cas5d|uniref:pre-crRNA processing endonuclease n=1 Tax=Methylococcus capsulatus TaxID=414 RepID=A0AA35V240_METCP|nr:type I-C CRISPR-associated protein Cas5c [Methylococcus capsulatus]CAI8753015.1 CRISPR-associated protein Cas5d [Methylococcus capsulatus]
MRGKTHCLEVWGDFACFTRPELKVERYSYPIITPSAARGIFDAIYWKKSYGFYWQVEKIEMLKPPSYIALRRNEVKDKAPGDNVILRWRDGRAEPEPLWADGDREQLGTDQKGRTQRQTTALKNVHYRLHAHLRFRSEGQDTRAFDAQFERRARGGQCYYQPFFGCREFPAFFTLADAEKSGPEPVRLSLDLGFMLYDVFDLSRDNDSHAPPSISVFHAQLTKGVMEIPGYDDPAVRKAVEENGHA